MIFRGLAALTIAMLAGTPAWAQPGLRRVERAVDELNETATGLSGTFLRETDSRSPQYVETRLTDAELFYRLRDYTRASIMFLDLVENYPDHPAFPDALFHLADSLFLAGDYFGARSHFRQILDRSNEGRFRPYVQRSLGRLIEIAIHTRDFAGVDDYFARLNQLPPGEIEASTNYVRAKYLYFRGDLDAARQAFEAVREGSPYYLQARYFQGVILVQQQLYPQAIEAFQRTLRIQADSPDAGAVLDLTRLALGRLFYETDRMDESITAYQDVSRNSRFFDAALYEAAWVFLRQGDATRAERALEVLTVSNPDSRYIPDAKILRGNLLLRNGQFDNAMNAFQDLVRQFQPVRSELDALIQEHSDPRQYFEELVRSNLEVFDASSFLPDLAVQWVRQEEDIERAIGMLSDLNTCRRYIEESERLIGRLEAALVPSNRVNAFPHLRRGREAALAIENRLVQLRGRLVRMEEGEGRSNPELQQIRRRRHEIERTIGKLPTSDDDFTVREEQMLRRFREQAQELARHELRVQNLEAQIVALEKLVGDAEAAGQPLGNALEIRTELGLQKTAMAEYRRQIEELREGIEDGRVQVGVGDVRYQRDERTRDEYRELVRREQGIVGSMGGSGARVASVLRKIDAADALLASFVQRLDVVVERKSLDVLRELATERERVAGYRQRLTELETEGADVIGHVTFENFRNVRQRFYDLVLRADVGIIDVAWARREEHRIRIESLTEERQRELQTLDDELNEVMDVVPPEQGGAAQ